MPPTCIRQSVREHVGAFLRFERGSANISKPRKPRSVWTAVDLSPLSVGRRPRGWRKISAGPSQSGAEAHSLQTLARHVQPRWQIDTQGIKCRCCFRPCALAHLDALPSRNQTGRVRLPPNPGMLGWQEFRARRESRPPGIFAQATTILDGCIALFRVIESWQNAAGSRASEDLHSSKSDREQHHTGNRALHKSQI